MTADLCERIFRVVTTSAEQVAADVDASVDAKDPLLVRLHWPPSAAGFAASASLRSREGNEGADCDSLLVDDVEKLVSRQIVPSQILVRFVRET